MEKEMDEGRKRTLGVIAAIFACRIPAAAVQGMAAVEVEGSSPKR
jgi:hypothetical protein